MNNKKIRSAGIVGVLTLAVALGVGFGNQPAAGAQSQGPTGNDKPDPSHPVVSSVSSSKVVLATTPNSSYEVRVDASTLVVKDGKFTTTAALKAGDKVLVNPSLSLPNGLENRSTKSTAPAAPAPPDTTGNPDKSKIAPNGDTGPVGEEKPGAPVNKPPAPPDTTGNPDKSEPVRSLPPATTDAGTPAGAPGAAPTASVLWVNSGSDALMSGVVRWSGGDTLIVQTPGVAYSEYAIHISGTTGYQRMLAAGTAPTAASVADVKVGSTLYFLGTDGGAVSKGFFSTKAVLVLPASGMPR